MSNNIISINFDDFIDNAMVDERIEDMLHEQEDSQYWENFIDAIACGDIEEGTTYRAYLESIRDRIESEWYEDIDFWDSEFEFKRDDLNDRIKEVFGKNLSDLNWVCSGRGHTWKNLSFEDNYKHFDGVRELLQTVSVDGNTTFDIDVDDKILIVKDYHHDCPMGSYTEMKIVDDDIWCIMQDDYTELYSTRKIISKKEYQKLIQLDNNQRDRIYKRWYGRQMRKLNKKIAYIKEKTGLKLDIEKEAIYTNYTYHRRNGITDYTTEYYLGFQLNVSVKY